MTGTARSTAKEFAFGNDDTGNATAHGKGHKRGVRVEDGEKKGQDKDGGVVIRGSAQGVGEEGLTGSRIHEDRSNDHEVGGPDALADTGDDR